MSARRRNVRPATAVLLGTPALALALSACGAGFQANTYANRNLDDASNADAGEIALRNVYLASPDEGIEHPAGSDVEMLLALANNSQQPDTLVEVRSSDAASAEIVVGGRSVDELELPAASLSDPELAVELTGLTRAVRAGEFVDVVFRFERNGEVTVKVPVGSPSNPEEREHSKNIHTEEE